MSTNSSNLVSEKAGQRSSAPKLQRPGIQVDKLDVEQNNAWLYPHFVINGKIYKYVGITKRMHIGKKSVKGKQYYYLEHSFREKDKLMKKEVYLGSEIPKNIEEIKTNFIYELMKEKYFDLFENIRKNFSQELRTMPASVKEKYLNYFIIKFTYDSNRIEGSTITLKETAKILEWGISPQNKPVKEIKETEAHQRVFKEMIDYHKDLSWQIILKWHQLLLQHTQPDIAGKVRRHQVKVAGSNAQFPVPAELDILLKEFFSWYNQNKEKLHPLGLAALVHLKFVSIHPFSDGNGRISRILMNFILNQRGYPMLNVKYSNRDSYYNALERAQTKPQKKAFILHLFRRYLKEYEK